MTLDMLRYFIALNEEKSYTEAAQTCFISQSALSRAISKLEAQAGCALLERSNRKVIRLTPAGEVMLAEARRLIQESDSILLRVRRAARENLRTVTVGYIAYGMLKDFRNSADSAEVKFIDERIALETVYGSAPEIKERLMSGELDCIILPECVAADMSNCRKCVYSVLSSCMMVPNEHPLFERKDACLSEFRNSRFVFYDPKELPEVFSWQLQACKAAGFDPNIIGYGKKLGDVEALIMQHGAVSISTQAFAYAENENMHVVKLIDLPPKGYVFVIRENAMNPAARACFELIENKEKLFHALKE